MTGSSSTAVAVKDAIAVFAREGAEALGHPRGRLFFDEAAAGAYIAQQLRGEVVFRSPLQRGGEPVGVKADTVLVKLVPAYECTICGNPVETRIWERSGIDYCEACYYAGRHHERRFAGLFAELEGASVWHTGGGCFALVVGSAPLIAATDGEAGLPDTEDGPWLVCEYADEDGWMCGEPVREAEGVDRAGLLEFVRAAQ